MKLSLFPMAVLLLSGLAAAQSSGVARHKAAASTVRSSSRDLNGVWTDATITPMERPRELGDKAFFTSKEAADYEVRFAQENNKDRRDGGAEADVSRAYNEAWWDRGAKVVPSLRTSLITEPADGRIPALTPAAQKAAALRAEALRGVPNGPEDRGIQERCIMGVNVGPPMTPTVYNNNFQIFQTPDSVAIVSEMVHDVRIIPTDGQPHLPSHIRLWLGDSRGHWEGNTLVVDTTNFNGQSHFRGADENLHVVERFTRVSPELMMYQFRIEDPTAFTKPWAAEIPFYSTKDHLYEYACHEGNYGMEGLMRGARASEKAAGESNKPNK